jgi:hypothetical protein
MYFRREGCNVQVCIDTETAVEKPVLLFSRECQSEAEAEILVKYLSDLNFKNNESLKKKFYNLGYADKKNHKRNLWK